MITASSYEVRWVENVPYPNKPGNYYAKFPKETVKVDNVSSLTEDDYDNLLEFKNSIEIPYQGVDKFLNNALDAKNIKSK